LPNTTLCDILCFMFQSEAEMKQDLREAGNVIQQFAKTMPSLSIQLLDTSQPMEAEVQLESLATRLHRLMSSVVGKEHESLISIGSGINDCEVTLHGIGMAINAQGKNRYTPSQKAQIAKQSFGVLRGFATHRHWEVSINGTRAVNPWRLILFEEPVPFVGVREAGAANYDSMPCPAFMGEPTGCPRMPKQLWPMVIDVYEACGEFGQFPR
jgi:hypothetical protein